MARQGKAREGGASVEDHPAAPDPPPLEEQDFSPLGRFVSKLEGEDDEKRAWLGSGVGTEILAAVDLELPEDATPKQRSALLCKITSARYRTYLKTDRPYRGTGERERITTRVEAIRAREARGPPETDLKPGEPIPPEIESLFG
jgi:hypothetical protein